MNLKLMIMILRLKKKDRHLLHPVILKINQITFG